VQYERGLWILLVDVQWVIVHLPAITNIKVKVKSPIVNSALSQLCDLTARCSSPLTGLEPAVSCKHSSVIWAVGHTSTIYCRYLPGS